VDLLEFVGGQCVHFNSPVRLKVEAVASLG
jgi:hypothetical protein